LFQTTKQNVSLHVGNVFREGELNKEGTVKEYLTVQTEGNRNVIRKVKYYILDAIISVGYRVKNIRRFPPDFMFQLTKEEFYGLNRNLIFQNGISSWGGTRKLPYAFTQPGFPEDFMFQLTKEEYNSLRCHNGTSNRRGGDRRALPYAFTQQGIGMLNGLLRSEIVTHGKHFGNN